jgi:hypothetical protein
VSTEKIAMISGICSLEMKIDVLVLFAVIYSSIENFFCIQMEKMLGAKHLKMSAICSFAYIPPTARHTVTCPL